VSANLYLMHYLLNWL